MAPPKSGWQIPAALTLFALLYCSVHPWASRRFQAPLTSFIKCASVHRRNRLIFHRAFATLLLVHSVACGFPCKPDHRPQHEQALTNQIGSLDRADCNEDFVPVSPANIIGAHKIFFRPTIRYAVVSPVTDSKVKVCRFPISAKAGLLVQHHA